MAPRIVSVVFTSLFAWIMVPAGHLSAALQGGSQSISNLRTQLAGTSWKAPASEPLRPGLASVLTFGKDSVDPAGYRYEATSQNSLTLMFNHGDKQIFRLAPDGKHLKFTWKNRNYTYELASPGAAGAIDLKTDLAGTAWKAAGALRPGLVATLTFTGSNVGPAGYRYEINAADSLTIYFNHGDTQLVMVTPDGKRMKFIWRGQEYAYDLVSN